MGSNWAILPPKLKFVAMLKSLIQLEKWGDSHHPAWLDMLRVLLGIFLFFKGASFIADTEASSALIRGSYFNLWSVTIIHYVAFAHIFGGILIAIGCVTRIAIIFQLPVLIGAVFFAKRPLQTSPESRSGPYPKPRGAGLRDRHPGDRFLLPSLHTTPLVLIPGSGPNGASESKTTHHRCTMDTCSRI